ncbi:caspase family protein [Nocardia sp. NPDC052001]|uniref:caspase family protein n=1 Tax=Nocardia sp. NPDC052001 TaxID=3154853 RepID=UPI00341B9AEA
MSARSFCDWVVKEMNHPEATLGSVEILTSGSGAHLSPTLENVTRSFDRWYDHCDQNEDNVAIFYFCGHGVKRESEYILLEDFGESGNRLLQHSVDVSDLYYAMARCRAKNQYFFVDACRQIPFKLLRSLSGDATRLLSRELSADTRSNAALVFATSGGAKAYGTAGQVSRFTDTLVKALSGLGGHPHGDEWVVSMPHLFRAVGILMQDDGGPAQNPTSELVGSSPVHIMLKPPLVPVTVACSPQAAIAGAELQLLDRGGVSPPGTNPMTVPNGWHFELSADYYTLDISFPAGEYSAIRKGLMAFPPRLATHVKVGQ